MTAQTPHLNLSASGAVAKIIGDQYTGSEITAFFCKPGFPEIDFDGSTKWRFVFSTFEKLQNTSYRDTNIAHAVFEQLREVALCTGISPDKSIHNTLVPAYHAHVITQDNNLKGFELICKSAYNGEHRSTHFFPVQNGPKNEGATVVTTSLSAL